MKIVKAPSRGADAAIARLERNRSRSERSADVVARRVIAQIRNDGDAAASRFVAQFDGVEIAPSELLIKPGASQSGARALTGAIDLAIERIERFHRGQLPAGYSIDGLTHRVRPLRRVGIYVPGGSAVYLSTLIMCAVPARIACVGELVVATTPAAAKQPELLETCERLGVAEIYRAGGPAGIAAMALGTATLRRVDKIVGPGNAYVTAAKKQLIGNVGIDMAAGPTELVLIADDDANETLVAADLLAQAEHGRDSAVICITFSRSAAVRIGDEVGRQLMEGNRAAEECIIRNSVIFQVTSGEEAVALANRIAPEHLSLHWAEARQWLDRLDNCGAIFVGSASPVAAGDYIAGPNHVLPTGGTARFTSPLGVYDFVKRSNIIELSDAESAAIAGAGAAIARFEGLPRHARSLELREGGRA
ncbi:MAG: histidinol dehydrogenase [Acidobacteriota bacterium]|jgi:histidinol dehydrogenase|nr:histidinol dehydrogenase [Acidobacteriota bacterium]